MGVMIDPKKTYRTRDGREVRIYAVEPHEVHGAWKDKNGVWGISYWESDGTWAYRNGDMNLIEFLPTRTLDVWVVMERDGSWMCYKEKPRYTEGALACLHIVREYEEGEGL